MKKRTAAFLLALVMVIGAVAAAGTRRTISVEDMELSVNGQLVTPTNGVGDPVEVFEYKGATYAPLSYLCSLLGIKTAWDEKEPSVAKIVDLPESVQTLSYDAPYVRVAGCADNGSFPVAVWVDFDPDTDLITNVTLCGYGNPAVMKVFGAQMNQLLAAKDAYVGKSAHQLVTGTDELGKAVAQAAESYLNTKDQFVIRPYQSMMTQRYMANNPYPVDLEKLDAETVVEVEIVAQYPEGALTLCTEDVLNNEKVTYPAGQTVASFTKANGDKVSVSSGVVFANKPGVAVISYKLGDMVLYDALDIYENYTTELSGADAYGKLIGVIDETDASVTYRVLGDKAMNFPGGTCGSTVVDVTVDKKTDQLSKVQVVCHSDSTYLANSWEYGGGFHSVGELIYAIDEFTAKFEGMSAKTPVTPYDLTTKEATGGVVVDGGVDMVVSGATRTPNAIVRAVNAAIEAYEKGESDKVDAFSSASVADYYGANAISGDELMAALNSFKGTYLISTVNPDGSPCIAFFIYGMVKDGDTYYLQLGLADNQSKQNLLRTGKVMAAYAAAPDEEKGYSMAGARMTATVVTDEALTAKLSATGRPAIFAEVTEFRSLG